MTRDQMGQLEVILGMALKAANLTDEEAARLLETKEMKYKVGDYVCDQICVLAGKEPVKITKPS